MNLKKMTWLVMIVFAVLVAPVTKIQTASAVSASFDGCGPGAPPIPISLPV